MFVLAPPPLFHDPSMAATPVASTRAQQFSSTQFQCTESDESYSDDCPPVRLRAESRMTWSSRGKLSFDIYQGSSSPAKVQARCRRARLLVKVSTLTTPFCNVSSPVTGKMYMWVVCVCVCVPQRRCRANAPIWGSRRRDGYHNGFFPLPEVFQAEISPLWLSRTNACLDMADNSKVSTRWMCLLSLRFATGLLGTGAGAHRDGAQRALAYVRPSP